MMVRDFQRVIGAEARAAGARRDGPAARRRRRLRRRRLQRDRHLPPRSSTTPGVRLVGSRPAATASRPAGTPRRSPAAAPGVLHGARVLPAAGRRRPDRSSRTRSPPAWTTPASARSTRSCTTSAAREYRPVTDAEAMEAFALLCRTEGIIPAIESAHALAGALDRLGRELGPDALLAGQPLRPRRQGRRHRRALVRARRRGGAADRGPPSTPTRRPGRGQQ